MSDEQAAPRRIAVLDVGKTNVKVVLFADGVEATARTMRNVVVRDGLYPHFDVPSIKAFVIDALAELWRREEGFDGVSVTTHGATAALLRGDDLALPVLDYEHPGPAELSAEYDRLRPGFGETYSPRLPDGLNLGAQLFWQAQRFPDAFAATTAIVTYPQYWSNWLTGVACTEPTSLGAHTDLWAPRDVRFSSMVDRLGWRAKMAPLRSAFDVLGSIRPEIGLRIGLDRPIPVACGIHDSNASLLPHLQSKPGRFSVVSTGTWVIALTIGGGLQGLKTLDAARDTLANVDAFSRPVPSARFMGGREFDQITGGAAVTPSASDIAKVIDLGIMVLPTFVPGTGPFAKNHGAWSHDPLALSPGEITAAASLYEALMTATCLDMLGAEGPVVIEGPFAKNDVFCQALQAVLGREVCAAEGNTGTSAGAARLLGSAHPLPQCRTFPNTVPPQISGVEDYARRWKAAVQAGAASG